MVGFHQQQMEREIFIPISYDKTANLTGKVDPSGNSYAYRYDGFSNLLQSIDPVNRAFILIC